VAAVAHLGLDALRERLVGHELPPGEVVLAPYETRIGDDAMRMPASAGPDLNPVWLMIAGLRGMGTSIEGIVGLADGSLADGVLFGELEIDQLVPLRAGTSYRVRGVITDLIRRSGRSGVFDVLVFRLVLSTRGVDHGQVECSFVLRRPGIAS
jgi:hypothetical protein